MLRSSVHPQYTTHPTFKTIGEAPKTRQSKEKMSHHPYARQVNNGSVLSTNRLYPISGLQENYENERDIVMRNSVDYSCTGWKQLQNLLHFALKLNDETLVNVILKSKLSITVIDNDPNDRTLWFALQMGDIETATKLFCSGTDIHRRHPGSGATYLHWLASKVDEKYYSFAILMMDYGADVHATDNTDNSVLHAAAEFGLPKLVEELVIRRQANIDIVNKSGQSVVYAAAKNPRAVDMLPMLIGYSKDIVTRNKRCIEAFYSLMDFNANHRQIKMLLDLGFPLDQYGRKGSTLLYEAVLEKKINLVKLLLEYGADVNNKLRNGKLPLHAAAQQNDPVIFKLLIEEGASVHVCSDDYNGQYPIHGACKRESLPNIKLLLRLGANVNVIDKNGRTPFSLVSTENFTEVQSFIIEHIAIVMAKENTINRSDLVKIRTSLDMQDYYEKCLVELQTMKETNVCENIPFFYFFDRSLIDLLTLVKVDFTKISDEFRSKGKDLFPVYYIEICHLCTQVEQMKFFMNEKAQIVKEISNHILPDVVVDLIAFYACLDEIKQTQQNYYFSLVKQ